MKWLIIVFLVLSTQAIYLKIHPGDSLPALIVEKDAVVSIEIKSQNNVTFSVSLTKMDLWDDCVHSGFTVCKNILGTEHLKQSDTTVQYSERPVDTLLVIKNESSDQYLEIEYIYQYHFAVFTTLNSQLLLILALLVIMFIVLAVSMCIYKICYPKLPPTEF